MPNKRAPDTPSDTDDTDDRLDTLRAALGDVIDNADLPATNIGIIVDALAGNGQPALAASTSRPAIADLAANAPNPPRRATSATGTNNKQLVQRNQATTIIAATTRIASGEATVNEALLAALRHAGSASDSAPLNVVIASATWEFPPERQLTTDDPHLTTNALNAALAAPTTPQHAGNPANPAPGGSNAGAHNNQAGQSLIAAGGICQPVAVDYDIPSFTSSARPVKAGLPSFQATRGGINYMSPPSISDPAAVAGTTIWTVAKDTDGTSKKPCMTIACPSVKQVLVYGIPTCTVLGNMQQRYNSELVNAWLTTTEAAAARMAELTLLTQITAGSTAVNADASARGLGAARELLPALDQAAAAMRYRQRQNRTSPTLRVILPEWVQDLLRADIARELAHDNDTPSADALALADQRLSNWFTTRNINPIWSLEDTAGTLAGPQAPGALNAWPTSTTALLFAEGTWVFLDGGRLDVGLVRDTALNANNQVAMFVEPFEAVAFRGIESLALTVKLSDTGLSAGGVTT